MRAFSNFFRVMKAESELLELRKEIARLRAIVRTYGARLADLKEEKRPHGDYHDGETD